MSLVTRCPHCATAFRVAPAQLSATSGKVRCGKCTTVFDGVAHLLADEAQGPVEPSPQLGLLDAGQRPVRLATGPDPEAASGEVTHGAAGPDEEVAPTVAAEFVEEKRRPPRYRVAWALLALLAVAALAAQAIHHWRTEIAVLLPESRPWLVATCEIAGCEVGLPRRPELLSIESSELQVDGQREAVIVLNAVLRNHAPFPQELPSLELTLTDAQDEALARRVLGPLDYVRERAAAEIVARGVAPGAELLLRVPLDTRRLPATGYRLYLFYP